MHGDGLTHLFTCADAGAGDGAREVPREEVAQHGGHLLSLFELNKSEGATLAWMCEESARAVLETGKAPFAWTAADYVRPPLDQLN